MEKETLKLEEQLEKILEEYQEQANLSSQHLFVIGCSTSEVLGHRIGTAGTDEVAAIIFKKLQDFQRKVGLSLAFQCCEHLNRAVVVERNTLLERNYEEVSVIPVRHAGGAMATYAYQNLDDPVVVEFIRADGGIDIGDTLIGMHLKHVAVPIRTTVKQLGDAHVNLAKSRPKLIGGPRAVYENTRENRSC